MSDLPDRLKDYITVAERIEKFIEKYPDGSLQARIVELSESMVVMEASAYRSPEDPRPGIGYSSMPIPATNAMLRNSEIETCETSAWGRAIAALGFEVRKGVASRNEIEAKTIEGPAPRKDGSLIGIARVGTKQTSDGQLRETPDGHVLGFRLESREGDRGGILVRAADPLASALALVREQWFNQPVTVWGTIEPQTFRPKDAKRDVTYQILALSRIQTREFTLPANETTAEEGSSGRPEPEVGAVFDERIAAPATPDLELDALPMFEEELA